MAKPPLPRPSMTPTPSIKEGAETAVVVDNAAFSKAMEDAGLAPDTISFRRAESQPSQPSIADLLEDEVIKEILADDLTNAEAKLFAGALWTGVHHKNVERARSAWRIVTFLLKYPTAAPDDIPPRLLTDTFFASYRMPRTTLSSLIHGWSKSGAFSFARDRLNAFPLTRWSQHRRNQMDVVCEWERQICARAEARRKSRLVTKLKGPKK